MITVRHTLRRSVAVMLASLPNLDLGGGMLCCNIRVLRAGSGMHSLSYQIGIYSSEIFHQVYTVN